MMRKSLRLPVLLAVVGMLALGWWLAKPKTRFTYGLQPVSQHSAILLTRHNAMDATYFWVEHVADDGKLLWSREVSPFQPADALDFSGIAANEDRIVLLGEGPGTTGKTIALSTKNGELLWETSIGAGSFSARIGRMLILDGSRAYVFLEQIVDENMQRSISAISLDNGQILWSRAIQEASPEYKPVLLAPGRLVVPSSNLQYTEIDGSTGKDLRDLPIERVGCEIPDGLLGYGGQELIAISRASTSAHIALPNKARATWRGPCGIRRTPQASDEYVLGTQSSTKTSIIKLPASGGTPVWQLELGNTSFEHFTSQTGVLPRFLPVIVATPEGNDILVVDLDRGKLVSREPIPLGSSAFVGSERGYVLTFDSHLYSLNPADGSLEQVMHLQGLSSRNVRSEDYQFGTLWLEAGGWATPDELPWVNLDVASGRVWARPPVVLADQTARGWKPPSY
ncbi:MAG: PQQ-binding-like beta-propeller repeat protein [Nannocystaceae bacterium]